MHDAVMMEAHCTPFLAVPPPSFQQGGEAGQDGDVNGWDGKKSMSSNLCRVQISTAGQAPHGPWDRRELHVSGGT
jgi:hypothetical protein